MSSLTLYSKIKAWGFADHGRLGLEALTMKFLMRFLFAALLIPALNAPAKACKGSSIVLNRPDRAVVLCYDKRLKGYFSSDCFDSRDKACEMRALILKNRYSPIKLNANELTTNENPDALACSKLHQKVRTLVDSEGNNHVFCESPKDRSLGPLFLIRWRT
jgi:hypothetical protein